VLLSDLGTQVFDVHPGFVDGIEAGFVVDADNRQVVVFFR
jgi:hypothetical protein